MTTLMKVLDLSTGEEKGVGETGELCFEGPQVMPGYFKNEKATSETLIDGWIHTGDIGYYDQVGDSDFCLTNINPRFTVSRCWLIGFFFLGYYSFRGMH